MLRWIDQSTLLSKLIERASLLLAKQRGLPVVVGLVLVVIGFVVQLVNVYADLQVLELLQVVVHNLGVLIALIGLLLADPMGR